jgi:hypothetical protein
MIINPARIDRKKTAMGAESSFSLTRQAQTNHYDRRIEFWKDRRILKKPKNDLFAHATQYCVLVHVRATRTLSS